MLFVDMYKETMQNRPAWVKYLHSTSDQAQSIFNHYFTFAKKYLACENRALVILVTEDHQHK